MVKNPPAMQETWVWSLGWEDPLEKKMATSVFLPGKSHEQKSLAGCSPQGPEREEHDLAAKLLYGQTYQMCENSLIG